MSLGLDASASPAGSQNHHAPQDVDRRREERALFARLQHEDGTAARDAIVARFMPLARQLARRYEGSEDLEDLGQVAAMGLVKAVDRFDPERGLAFSSFAFPTIQGELKRHLRDRSWSVRVPRSVQELAARVERLSKTLTAELGRAPTVAELAEATDSSAEEVLDALQTTTARRAMSLDQPRHAAYGSESASYEPAVDDAGFGAVDDATMIDDLLRHLDARERLVLSLRFDHDLTQSRIAEIMGISQMRVSRMIRGALETLRAASA